MIKPKYGVKCLHLGFDRYKRYCKLPVTVKPSSTTISFYVEKPSTPKGKNARVSNHHPNIQHYTDDGRQPSNIVQYHLRADVHNGLIF